MGFDRSALRPRSASRTTRRADSNHGIVRAHVAEIEEARESGATWSSIANALGLKVSADAVRQYYLAAVGRSSRRKRVAAPAAQTSPPARAASAAPAAAAPVMATAVRRCPLDVLDDFGIVLSEHEDAIARQHYQQYQDNLGGLGKRLDDDVFEIVGRWIDGQMQLYRAAKREWKASREQV